jgi:hypothetical protein
MKKAGFIILSVLLILTIVTFIFFNSKNLEGFDTTTVKSNMLTESQIYEMQSNQNTANSGFINGFAGSGSNLNIIGKNYFDPSYNSSYYDSNNYDIQYHDDITVIASKPDAYGLPQGTTFAQDASGNLIAMLDPKLQKYSTYYPPGTYSKYGTRNYVPSYEDSVYLSQTYNFLPKSLYSK